jgi:glycosyltransferase involved in cell wall biosynthesis
MKKHIAAFFQHMPPYGGAGALRGHSIATGLARLDPTLRVSFFCTNKSPTQYEGISVESLNIPETENISGLIRRILGELIIGLEAAKKIILIRKKIDFVIVSSPAYLSAVIQVYLYRIFNVPYILELRDIYPQVYYSAGLIKKNSLVYRSFSCMSKHMYNNAVISFTATQGLKWSVQQDAPSANIVHVYNGFPANFLRVNTAKYTQFTVCFHGVLGLFQDIETLIKVAQKLEGENVQVVVVGYGSKASLLESSNLVNLKYYGRRTFDETILEVSRCHMGLSLRNDDEISSDAFPVKVWEYLGLGIPCLITPPSEAGTFVLENKCGVVCDAGDVEMIVRNILFYKNNPEEYLGISSICRNIARDYTRERTGYEIAQLILKTAYTSL